MILERFSLAGKVAVVTGASSGLGRGFARALADAGADVVAAARRPERLDALVAEISAGGRRALAVRADVTEEDDCESVVRATTEEFGRLDILVNNAGRGEAVPAIKEDAAEFRDVLDTNLTGAFLMARACARVMRPGSSIVNVSSVLAFVMSYAPQAGYSASKAGVLGLTRDLAQQWTSRKGIRVNAVAPGYFESEMTADIPGGLLEPFLENGSCMGRLGRQEELDAAVVFLASDAASFITGTTLAVDGGMSGH